MRIYYIWQWCMLSTVYSYLIYDGKKMNTIVNKLKNSLISSNNDGTIWSADNSFGFSNHIQANSLNVSTHIIFGSNSIEHGINLLDNQINDESSKKNVLLVTGWNQARAVDLMWELEPKCYNLVVYSVIGVDNAFATDVESIVDVINANNINIVIAAGSGTVIDVVKLACNSISNEIIVKLVIVPTLPSLGSELHIVSNIAKFRHYGINNRISLPTYSEITKVPDLCIVQPSFGYRASSDLICSRLISTIALAIDLILTDNGFLTEVVAWNALHELISLLSKTIGSNRIKLQDWESNLSNYIQPTVHDDETSHESQATRRYKSTMSTQDIDSLFRISTTLMTVRKLMKVSPLHYLVSVIHNSVLNSRYNLKDSSNMDVDGGIYLFSHLLTELFPLYLTSISNWCDQSDLVEAKVGSKSYDTLCYKQFISSRLERISQMFGNIELFHSSDVQSDNKSSHIINQLSSQMMLFNEDILPTLWGVINPCLQFGWSKNELSELVSKLNTDDMLELKTHMATFCSPDTPLVHFTSDELLTLFKFISNNYSAALYDRSCKVQEIFNSQSSMSLSSPNSPITLPEYSISQEDLDILEEHENEDLLRGTTHLTHQEIQDILQTAKSNLNS